MFLIVWSNYYTEERKILSVKVDLLLMVSWQVLNTWVDIKDRVAVVPCKLLNSVFIHLILNFYLLFIRNFTVFQPYRWNLNTAFRRINFANHQYFDMVFSPFAIRDLCVVYFSSEQSNDLVFGQVRMNVHENLDLKRKIYSIGLLFKCWVTFTID